jgi:hypothetical protein
MRKLSSAARIYMAGIAGLALALAVLLWPVAVRPAEPVTILFVIGFGMLAHAFPVQAARHQAYQATLPFIVLAAALFGTPQLLGFILLIHLAEQLRARRPWYIQFFNVCDYFVSAAAAGLLYRFAAGSLQVSPLAEIEAGLAAGCAFVLLNRLMLVGILWLARGITPACSALFKADLLAADLVITWVSTPMLILAALAGPWAMLLSIGPLLLVRPALSYLLTQESRAVQREATAA